MTHRVRTPSRRAVVATAAGAISGLLTGLPAVGPARSVRAHQASPVASPKADGPRPDGSWAFTDDHGRTTVLPTPPERIAAFVTAGSTLWDLGIRPVSIFGRVHRSDGSLQPTVGKIDLDQVEIISQEAWATDLETFVAARPDLIVTTTWTDADPSAVWGIDAEVFTRAQEIAPIIAINYGTAPLLTAIVRFEELAAALGADPSAPEVVADATAFDAAVAAVESAIAAKPDLTTVWVAGSNDGVWICGPDVYSDLHFFADLGLTILSVEGGTGADLVSWESIGDYTADVIFNDARETGVYYTPEELITQPMMEFQPAVAVGQVEPWYYEFVPSRAGFTFVLTELAAALERSLKVTT